MSKGIFGLFISLSLALPAAAQTIGERHGWAVYESRKSYPELLSDLKQAVKDHGLNVVTNVGPTEAAKRRGIKIPGNRVIGVFSNVYAVQMLKLSVPAMIEAPIRFYVTEEGDGTATLSYKTPTHVFAPYLDEATLELEKVAFELDQLFATIAVQAAGGDDG